jgi:hypothetical protein
MTPLEPRVRLGGRVDPDDASVHGPNGVRVRKAAAFELLTQREEVIAFEHPPTGIAELSLYRSEEFFVAFGPQVAAPFLETRLRRMVIHVGTL